MPTQAIKTILQLTGSLQTLSGIVFRLPLRCAAGGPTNPFSSSMCSDLPRQGTALPDNRIPTHADDSAMTATRLFDSHPLVGSLDLLTEAPTGNGKFNVILFFSRCQQEFSLDWHGSWFSALREDTCAPTTRFRHTRLSRTKSRLA